MLNVLLFEEVLKALSICFSAVFFFFFLIYFYYIIVFSPSDRIIIVHESLPTQNTQTQDHWP